MKAKHFDKLLTGLLKTPKMKKENSNTVQQENKLVRWYDANFPPIDLREQATHVTNLVRRYKALKAANKELREALQIAQKGIIDNSCFLAASEWDKIEAALNSTKEVS